jgi:hypothetical protein
MGMAVIAEHGIVSFEQGCAQGGRVRCGFGSIRRIATGYGEGLPNCGVLCGGLGETDLATGQIGVEEVFGQMLVA